MSQPQDVPAVPLADVSSRLQADAARLADLVNQALATDTGDQAVAQRIREEATIATQSLQGSVAQLNASIAAQQQQPQYDPRTPPVVEAHPNQAPPTVADVRPNDPNQPANVQGTTASTDPNYVANQQQAAQAQSQAVPQGQAANEELAAQQQAAQAGQSGTSGAAQPVGSGPGGAPHEQDAAREYRLSDAQQQARDAAARQQDPEYQEVGSKQSPNNPEEGVQQAQRSAEEQAAQRAEQELAAQQQGSQDPAQPVTEQAQPSTGPRAARDTEVTPD